MKCPHCKEPKVKLIKCEHCGDMVDTLYKSSRWVCADCFIGYTGEYPPTRRAND